MTPTEMHERAGASFARLVGDQDRWVAHPRGRTDPRVSPLTGLALPTVALTDPAALDEVFTTARAAQDRWAATPVKRRVRVLAKLQEVLLDRAESVLDVVQWETGKARRYAYEEVLDVVQNTRFYAKSARQMLRPEKVPGAVPLISTARVHRRPIGVVGVIAPWNYPLALAASDALAALYAGNAVVIKPASRTPLSELVVAAMLEEAGVPTGLFQVVSGSGATLGQALIERSDFVMFTGSTEVGRGIAQACGSRLIGCAAELGGKNASIVLPDAELDKWLPGALHECFASSGQRRMD